MLTHCQRLGVRWRAPRWDSNPRAQARVYDADSGLWRHPRILGASVPIPVQVDEERPQYITHWGRRGQVASGTAPPRAPGRSSLGHATPPPSVSQR